MVGPGVDIGIDAKRDRGGLAERRRGLAQQPELGLRFHIEGEDALLEREGHLVLGLADAGEGDSVGRDANGERAAKLAFGDDVHAGAKPRQRGQHAEIGVGLDRVAHLGVGAGKGVGEDAIVALERRRRIAIEGRADRVGDVGEADILGMEDARARNASAASAAPVSEVVHGGL